MSDPPKRNDPCPCGSGAKFKRCCGSPRTTFSDDDRTLAFDNLQRWFDREDFESDLELAAILFWGEWRSRLPESDFEALARSPAAAVNFVRFFQADLLIEGDRRLIDMYLQDRGPVLLPGERRFLEALSKSHLGIYELVEAKGADTLLLRDLVSDQGSQWVRVDMPVRDFGEPGSVLVARLLPDPTGAPALRDDVYSFEAERKQWLFDCLEEVRSSTRYSRIGDPGFLKLVAPQFQTLWMQAEFGDPDAPADPPEYPYLHAHCGDYLEGSDLAAAVSAEVRKLGIYLGRIVARFTGMQGSVEHGEAVSTELACRRRPNRRPCAGELHRSLHASEARHNAPQIDAELADF
ncbi:MAG: SEC-C metal-binding domain-containing protein, partial [Planctomycetota bacterium]